MHFVDFSYSQFYYTITNNKFVVKQNSWSVKLKDYLFFSFTFSEAEGADSVITSSGIVKVRAFLQ